MIKILIVGTGGIGGYCAGELFQINEKNNNKNNNDNDKDNDKDNAFPFVHVSVLCRSDYDYVKEHGITITCTGTPQKNPSTFHFDPHAVYSYHEKDTNQIPIHDIVMITTKVLPKPIMDLPTLLQPLVGPTTAIALIQNGIDIETDMATMYPHNEIISGLARIGVTRPKFGHVEYLAAAGLILGTYQQQQDSSSSTSTDANTTSTSTTNNESTTIETTNQQEQDTSTTSNDNNNHNIGNQTKLLFQCFQQTNINVSLSSNITTERWKKVLWNGTFNPLSVLSGGATTKELLQDDISKRHIQNVMTEIWTVATASGYPFDQAIIDQTIQLTERIPFDYKTSMYVDYQNHHPMEVEAILGNVIRAAQRVNVPVPHLFSMYAMLRLVDAKNQQR